MSSALSPYSLRAVPAQVSRDDTEFETFVEPAPEGGTFDLLRYWRAVRKRLWIVIAVPLVAASFVAYREIRLPDLYTASSTILIRSSAPKVFGESAAPLQASGSEADAGDTDMVLATKYELLQTPDLALQVIRADDLVHNDAFTGVALKPTILGEIKSRILGSKHHPHAMPVGPPEEYVGLYLGSLAIEPVTGTQLVHVSFTTRDPKLSAELANAHVRQFIAQGIQLNAQASEDAERFLRNKLADLKRKVEDSEAALNNYRRDKGIVPGLITVDGKEDVVLDRLNRLNEQLQDAHLKTITLGARIALINQGHADALPSIADDGVVQKLKDRRAELEEQYAAMAKDFKPSYPPLQELKARIEDTDNAIKAEEGGAITTIKTQYLEAQQDEQDLEEELKKEKDFALGLNQAAVRYQILARDADTNRELYNSVLKRLRDVEVTGDVHTSDVSIVDQAQPPGGPSSPERSRAVFNAFFAGLLGALGIIFLLEQLDNTLKDVDQVERYLGIPSLGTIPNFLGGSEKTSAVYALRGGKELQKADADFSREIVLSYGSYSSAGEAYRMLRTAFVLSRAGSPPKTALITSAVKGDGKTVTAVNLAIMLAMTHRKVILVDADLRLPRCHDLLARDNFTGLTEVLTGARHLRDSIQDSGIENLDLLSSGEIPPNPSELLGSEKMRAVLAELEDIYDYVIIDSTPVTQTSESMLLSSLVDGVIVVARTQSPRQQVRSALAQLRYARAKILGLVLNKTGASDTDRYHYQYYAASAPQTTSE